MRKSLQDRELIVGRSRRVYNIEYVLDGADAGRACERSGSDDFNV